MFCVFLNQHQQHAFVIVEAFGLLDFFTLWPSSFLFTSYQNVSTVLTPELK